MDSYIMRGYYWVGRPEVAKYLSNGFWMKMKLALFLLSISFLARALSVQGASAETARFILDREKSEVAFSGALGSMHAEGVFNDYSGAIVMNGETGEPLSVNFSAVLSTVSFTVGAAQERMVLQTIAASLPQAAAKYQSSGIIKTTGKSFVSHGSITAFGKDFDMKVPFSIVEATKTGLRVTGVMNDKGKVLPFEVPGVSPEFAGRVKFDLRFLREK